MLSGMLPVLLPSAWAIDAGTPRCTSHQVDDTLPGAGDVAPEGVRPLLFLDGVCTGELGVRLFEGATEHPVEIDEVSPALLRVVPAEPLVAGSYLLEVDQLAVPFDVGAVPPGPGSPVVDAEFGSTCGDATILTTTLAARFDDADRAQRGALLLLTSVDGIHQGVVDAVPYVGTREVDLSDSALGGRQLCAWLRFDDLTGATLWTTDEVCGAPVECPVAVAAEGGCGCRATGGASGLVAVGLLLARRRRR